MNFRELIKESSVKEWKKSLESSKEFKEIKKELSKYGKINTFISDLGTALAINVMVNGVSNTVYIGYDDGNEGLEPKDYTRENKLPLIFQTELNDGEVVEVYHKIDKVISYLKSFNFKGE